jgi:AcrR family transcriptional regulator
VTAGWLDSERSGLAVDRILDAAGSVFEDRGVAGASMEDVARAAGCSRATVYRYFADRNALRLAFVHRETRRVGARVAAAIASVDDPAERVVEAVVRSVAEVRGVPALHAWFSSWNAEVTGEVVRASPVMRGLAAGLVGGDDPEASYRAEWLVRTVVSLLLFPGVDEASERALLERFLGPVLAAAPVPGRRA